MFPSGIRLSLDDSFDYLVSLKYLVYDPHVHKVHLGRDSGSVVSYPYLHCYLSVIIVFRG